MCLESMEIENQSKRTLSEAMHSFDPPETLDDWELGWYSAAANLLGEEKYILRANKAYETRGLKGSELPEDDILRPSICGDLVTKETL